MMSQLPLLTINLDPSCRDENGNEIATPVTYNNDPSDPNKAATTDVPTIPSWTTTTTSVDPTDPGADTKVVYTQIVMPSPSNDSQENPDNSSSKTITDYIDYTTHTITTFYTDQDQLLTTTTNSTAESNGQESAQLSQTGNDEHWSPVNKIDNLNRDFLPMLRLSFELAFGTHLQTALVI